ncbi:hypothetical protein L8T89_07955, partial [Campylobacter lari]|nr:hypothetical protein [Campylobacter lari]
MFKNVIKFATLSILISSSAIADDFLSKISNGALSDTSIGVKTLSLNEMKDVKGGYQFSRASKYDNFRSYAYYVYNDNFGSVNSELQVDSHKTVLAKYRYVNNQKDYYLQTYDPKTNSFGTIFPNSQTSWGINAGKILNDFR